MSGEISLVKSEIEYTPFDQQSDYLPVVGKNTGIEALSKDDYKTPRILLLQSNSPQLITFEGVAKSGHFWHTGLNVSLGAQFDFVPALAAKRVILWRPRSDNGGMLAFSKDGKTWQMGGNQEFRVKLKGKKEPVLWSTGKDVLSSRLTEFGTSDPDTDNSPPAATIAYEYMCYLPKNPELSPCVLGVSKTGLPNGKTFNTSLAMIARTNTPIWCVGVRCFAQEMSNNDGAWTIPNFKLLGRVPKSTYEIVQKISETYNDYNIEYSQEDELAESKVVDDEIKY